MIYFLSGRIQSGKSGFLHQHTQTLSVSGILTPTVGGLKTAFDCVSKEFFPFELSSDDPAPCLEVGRYRLSKEAFMRMNRLIERALRENQGEWLLIDEVGKLELREEGLYPGLCLARGFAERQKQLWVVREELTAAVGAAFDLAEAPVFYLDREPFIRFDL